MQQSLKPQNHCKSKKEIELLMAKLLIKALFIRCDVIYPVFFGRFAFFEQTSLVIEIKSHAKVINYLNECNCTESDE